jgi:hypothetical protein
MRALTLILLLTAALSAGGCGSREQGEQESADRIAAARERVDAFAVRAESLSGERRAWADARLRRFRTWLLALDEMLEQARSAEAGKQRKQLAGDLDDSLKLLEKALGRAEAQLDQPAATSIPDEFAGDWSGPPASRPGP